MKCLILSCLLLVACDGKFSADLDNGGQCYLDRETYLRYKNSYQTVELCGSVDKMVDCQEGGYRMHFSNCNDPRTITNTVCWLGGGLDDTAASNSIVICKTMTYTPRDTGK